MQKKFHDEFMKGVREISGFEGWNYNEVMTNFLDAAFFSMKKPTLIGQQALDCEQAYMSIVQKCHKPQKTMQKIAELLALLVQALTDSMRDFLGPVFMECSQNKNMGQFFTPDSLSRFMGQILCTESISELLQRQSHILISEPACGAGGMAINLCRAMMEHGINYQEKVCFYMQDLDRRAYMASYVQCSLIGLPAVVSWGNSLAVTSFEQSWTVMLFLQPWLRHYPKALEQEQSQVLASEPIKVIEKQQKDGTTALMLDLEALV